MEWPPKGGLTEQLADLIAMVPDAIGTKGQVLS